MDIAAKKQRVFAQIDRERTRISAIGRKIYAHPELGYKEHRTSALMQKTFGELGLFYQSGLAITGVKAAVTGSVPGPMVALLGELDAVASPRPPLCRRALWRGARLRPQRPGSGHAGAAMRLFGSGVMDQLSGRVAFMAVPAEDFVELEYRQKLRQEGKIDFIGGKHQLPSEGDTGTACTVPVFFSAGR